MPVLSEHVRPARFGHQMAAITFSVASAQQMRVPPLVKSHHRHSLPRASTNTVPSPNAPAFESNNKAHGGTEHSRLSWRLPLARFTPVCPSVRPSVRWVGTSRILARPPPVDVESTAARRVAHHRVSRILPSAAPCVSDEPARSSEGRGTGQDAGS